MGIKTITATEVSCQRCHKKLLVENWQDAPVDPRLVDFVRGAGKLLGSTHLNRNDYCVIESDDAQALLRLLRDAEEAIAAETDA